MEVSELMGRDTPGVQERINAVTAGFQSGTRIAESLKSLKRLRPSLTLNRRSRLWIFSDGYDTDPPEALPSELAELTARGVRVDWFYPTRQRPQSEAALASHAHVHHWFPANDLASLRSSLQQASF
jgi:uncharacterized protein with von Willebrand factor type A (vWA) domain